MSQMFTGRIEEIGEVIGISSTRVVVRAPECAGRLRPGGSLTVSGVCLTVEETADGGAVHGRRLAARRGVCCEVMGPDGVMAGAADVEAFALRWSLPLVSVTDLKCWL